MKIDREFALASASLRQALQDMPELTEVSKHIMFEETKQGLNLEIVDQDGRSMFADGSKVPYDRTRRLMLDTDGSLAPRGQAVMAHTPAKRFGEPQDLLGAVCWLLDDDRAGFVTGVTVPVDGGFLASAGV